MLLEELGRCGGLSTYLMFTQLLLIFLTLIWFVSSKSSVGGQSLLKEKWGLFHTVSFPMVLLLDEFSLSECALESGWQIQHNDNLCYIQRLSPTLHFCKKWGKHCDLFIYLFIYFGGTGV
jgi:hypothetical protein